MRCGRATDEQNRPGGAPWEVDRSPLPGATHAEGLVLDHVDHDAPQPDYFGWQVWHELGHSIDDQLGFMKKNQTSATYGGWQEHGRDVKPIADAAAAHFACNNAASKAHIEKLLAGRSPDAPDEAEGPESKRLDIRSRYDAIRTRTAFGTTNRARENTRSAAGCIMRPTRGPGSATISSSARWG